MIILGIETASETLSVAIAREHEVIAEYLIRKKNIHDTMLSELTKQILSDNELSAEQLGGIAVSSGPGSFTGLRIGMSFAKGLAYGASLQLVCVPTFDSIAYMISQTNLLNEIPLSVIFDARREDVYVANYIVHEKSFTCIKKAYAAHVVEAEKSFPLHTWLTGNGAEKLIEHTQKQYPIIEGELAECRASGIALLGLQMISRGEIADLATCEPYYAKEFFTTSHTQ